MEPRPGNSSTSFEKGPNSNHFRLVRHLRLSSGNLFKFSQPQIDNSSREFNCSTSSGIDSRLQQSSMNNCIREVQVDNPVGRLVNPLHLCSLNSKREDKPSKLGMDLKF
ncbi:hypothetical protein V6N13_133015 [Hibiscus sabdariffa]|uniref:Uncharacterized protein n=1 Tax=Hibiscus sabdariffa TaxID=183260 RepID=A0ABR2PX08_9ROSI